MKINLIPATLLGLLGMLSFHFTADAQPVVTTLPAAGITATTVYFQYGTDTNYGYIGGFTVLPATALAVKAGSKTTESD